MVATVVLITNSLVLWSWSGSCDFDIIKNLHYPVHYWQFNAPLFIFYL